MAKPTQMQMFYQAHANLSRANETFLHMVNSGMTRQNLERLIAAHPERWERFEVWLEVLPEEKADEV